MWFSIVCNRSQQTFSGKGQIVIFSAVQAIGSPSNPLGSAIAAGKHPRHEENVGVAAFQHGFIAETGGGWTPLMTTHGSLTSDL